MTENRFATSSEAVADPTDMRKPSRWGILSRDVRNARKKWNSPGMQKLRATLPNQVATRQKATEIETAHRYAGTNPKAKAILGAIRKGSKYGGGFAGFGVLTRMAYDAIQATGGKPSYNPDVVSGLLHN